MGLGVGFSCHALLAEELNGARTPRRRAAGGSPGGVANGPHRRSALGRTPVDVRRTTTRSPSVGPSAWKRRARMGSRFPRGRPSRPHPVRVIRSIFAPTKIPGIVERAAEGGVAR